MVRVLLQQTIWLTNAVPLPADIKSVIGRQARRACACVRVCVCSLTVHMSDGVVESKWPAVLNI